MNPAPCPKCGTMLNPYYQDDPTETDSRITHLPERCLVIAHAQLASEKLRADENYASYERVKAQLTEVTRQRGEARRDLVTIAAHLDAYAKRLGLPELASLADQIRAALEALRGK